MMAAALLLSAVAISVAIGLTVYRLAVGPEPTDRILALDTLVINSIALIVVAGLHFRSAVHFEAALLFAMVGFLTTVAFCKFFLRGNVIE